MAYGRHSYGRGLYAGIPLDVVTDLAGTAVVTATTTGQLGVELVLTASATATATGVGEILTVIALSGTSDFAFVASGILRQIVPPSPVPDGVSTTTIQRVSPVMPAPTIVDGKPT